MEPGKYNLVIYEGTTFDLTLTWKDPEGALIDLTSYTARLQVRPTALDAGTPLLEMTTTNGKIALGGAAGTIRLLLAATETAILGFKKGVYDLEMVTGATVVRLLEGKVKVSQEVTK